MLTAPVRQRTQHCERGAVTVAVYRDRLLSIGGDCGAIDGPIVVLRRFKRYIRSPWTAATVDIGDQRCRKR